MFNRNQTKSIVIALRGFQEAAWKWPQYLRCAIKNEEQSKCASLKFIHSWAGRRCHFTALLFPPLDTKPHWDIVGDVELSCALSQHWAAAQLSNILPISNAQNWDELIKSYKSIHFGTGEEKWKRKGGNSFIVSSMV